MELISGFLLWITVDVFGIKSIRKEKDPLKKAAIGAIFIFGGVLAFITFLVLTYS